MRLTPLALAAAGLLALPACDSGDDAVQTATATVAPPAGVTAGGISGTVTLTQDGDEVSMRLNLTGATPGEHGFHIHTVGSCATGVDPGEGTAPIPAGAALGHYDPLMTMDHGAPSDSDADKHVADFGNVTASSAGTITTTLTTNEITLTGDRSVSGRPVMFHANRDDLETDPGGMSGPRVGCGVISAVTTATAG